MDRGFNRMVAPVFYLQTKLNNMKNITPFMYLIGYDENFKKACNTGWGCGYVAIPTNHAAAISHFDRIKKQESESPEIGYNYVNKYFECNCEQEITYTERDIINGDDYLVIGFDLAHSWNNKEHDFYYCFRETSKLLELINTI